jgi:hypothetical protein
LNNHFANAHFFVTASGDVQRCSHKGEKRSGMPWRLLPVQNVDDISRVVFGGGHAGTTVAPPYT